MALYDYSHAHLANSCWMLELYILTSLCFAALTIPLVAFSITKHLLLHSHMPVSDGLLLPHPMLFWISLHVGWGHQSPDLWVLAWTLWPCLSTDLLTVAISMLPCSTWGQSWVLIPLPSLATRVVSHLGEVTKAPAGAAMFHPTLHPPNDKSLATDCIKSFWGAQIVFCAMKNIR